jgi:hypothetical protein
MERGLRPELDAANDYIFTSDPPDPASAASQNAPRTAAANTTSAPE